jgi:hypothetical protein
LAVPQCPQDWYLDYSLPPKKREREEERKKERKKERKPGCHFCVDTRCKVIASRST